MAIETDTQRAIYFDTDEFGTSATFTDVSTATATTIKGMFDKDSQEIILSKILHLIHMVMLLG